MENKSYREQLIDKAWENEQIFAEKRGYSSCESRDFLYILSNEALERANAECEKNFKKWGWV